jgi:hypothetical protein
VDASGNTTAIDPGAMVGEPILSLRSWGKHFLIELPDMALRIHFLLFGTWRINERREGKTARLSLTAASGDELNVYACSVKQIDPDLDAAYDWSADVMSDQWNPAKARKKLAPRPTCWPATRCSTRPFFPASATSSRTKCCSASGCTPAPGPQQPAQLFLRALPEMLRLKPPTAGRYLSELQHLMPQSNIACC